MRTDRNILVAFILNLFFSAFELFGGLFTGSISILSDSLHDLGDSLSIGISYFLEKKSKKSADNKYTYGYIRYSVLGGMITSIILFTGSLFVIIESTKRLFNPTEINYDGMIIFAIFGVVINLIASYFTREGDSLNQKSVNLHMLEDVLGWCIVLIGSIVIKFTRVMYIDSILSILVACFILYNTIKNMKSIVDLFLEKTPSNIDIEKIKEHLNKIDGVCGVHHIHVRSIDGYNVFASLHVVVRSYDLNLKHKIKEELFEHGVSHSTIEIELESEKCDDEVCTINHNSEQHCHHH